MARAVSCARALGRGSSRIAALAAACMLAGCASLGFGGDEKGDSGAVFQQMREMQAERHAADRAAVPAKEPTLEEHLRDGDRLRQSGDLPRALWAYLRAHALDREDPRPRARIGAVHLQIDPQRAEHLFRELVQSTGGSALSRTGLALALIGRQDWNAAIVELRAALREDDDLAVAHDALGVALERTGDVAGARESYRRAAALQPRGYEALNNLGVSYLRTGEFAAAADALAQAARLGPRDRAVSNNLGLALGRLERYDDALAAFRKATDSEQAALNNLGYVHYLNGDYAGALEVYERALLAPGGSEHRLAVLRNLRRAKRAQDGGYGASPPVSEEFDAGPPSFSGDPDVPAALAPSAP